MNHLFCSRIKFLLPKRKL